MSRRSGSRDPDLMTHGQAAELLGLDRDTGRLMLLSYSRAGKIETLEVKPGVFRLRRSEVERLRSAMNPEKPESKIIG